MLSHLQTIEFLRGNGYRESTEVLSSGDFQVLGDVVVCWPTTEASPYRLHFFGEELEKIERQVQGSWLSTADLPDLTPNHLVTDHGVIHPGEYVVHPVHGVGILLGITNEPTVDGAQRSFIALQYAGNDRLLVPHDRPEGLMPYIGSRHPRLTRLYSKSWLETKERIQRDLIAVARGLLRIFAERQLANRVPVPKAPEWEEALARSAGFTLTPDQAKAIREIQHSLEHSPHPMDHLLCGDVGFGKTEVALRAAAQVLAAGKQVALVAPTTVLARQHSLMVAERFESLPVRVGAVHRLATASTSSLAGLADGSVDFVVGTHRLLAPTTQFHNLGLLIVDEEQKFGVAQKEALKKLRPKVDVLSMSATPIPRTLSMSLSGLRGLSTLRTPPQGRRPILTAVQEYTDEALQRVILDELAREGQVFVVHNRVRTIQTVEERIRTVLKGTPYQEEAIGVVHGQLGQRALAEQMGAFMSGKVRILLGSSILEHGLDCPNANALVVLHSERFGLSDLYQLRGRVGRRTEQAQALFFTGGIEHEPYAPDAGAIAVSERSKQRLAALLEADVLGSGWSIALRDLEIRGGGNILGNEQHGNLESIGLLLYSQLLQEEIGRQAAEQGIQLFQSAES